MNPTPDHLAPRPQGYIDKTYAKDQPQYRPLYVVQGPAPEFDTVSEWTPTADELAALNAGGRIRLSLWLFQQKFNDPRVVQPNPLTPSKLEVVTAEGAIIPYTETEPAAPPSQPPTQQADGHRERLIDEDTEDPAPFVRCKHVDETLKMQCVRQSGHDAQISNVLFPTGVYLRGSIDHRLTGHVFSQAHPPEPAAVFSRTAVKMLTEAMEAHSDDRYREGHDQGQHDGEMQSQAHELGKALFSVLRARIDSRIDRMLHLWAVLRSAQLTAAGYNGTIFASSPAEARLVRSFIYRELASIIREFQQGHDALRRVEKRESASTILIRERKAYVQQFHHLDHPAAIRLPLNRGQEVEGPESDGVLVLQLPATTPNRDEADEASISYELAGDKR